MFVLIYGIKTENVIWQDCKRGKALLGVSQQVGGEEREGNEGEYYKVCYVFMYV
jgi:hypothetical protein